MKKWLFLLRAFFPSWKFFDDVGPELRLEVRYGENSHTLGEWQNCLPPISRSFLNLVINAKGNYLHACHNLINHLSSDIAECDLANPESLMTKPTYKITCNLVRYQLGAQGLRAGVYQFRLSANYLELAKAADHLLVSEVYNY